MINFFRKKRKKMADDNKALKYTRYAIGEIVLVVIGILIALQINTWNEISKQRQIEQEYLFSLKEEFNYNLIALEKAMSINEKNFDNALKISNLMGPQVPVITEKEFAKLAMNMTNFEVQYRPNQAVLDEIISSGKLSVFKNNKLKFALSSSNGLLNKVKFQEAEHGVVRMQIIETMNTLGNAKKMVVDAGYGDSFNISESKFQLGNLQLLQSQKFENELIDFIFTAQYLNTNYYSDLKKEIKNILELIELEISE